MSQVYTCSTCGKAIPATHRNCPECWGCNWCGGPLLATQPAWLANYCSETCLEEKMIGRQWVHDFLEEVEAEVDAVVEAEEILRSGPPGAAT